jgi:RNA polymerase sigma-70 factor, ECF subfamily
MAPSTVTVHGAVSSPESRAIGPRATTRDETALDEFDEGRIAAAVLEGDRDAFRRLVDREAGAVVRTCFRILGSQAEAEDAAQEAFVTAYRSLATWRRDGPFGAWVSRIATRIALRQAGKRRKVAWAEPLGDAALAVPASTDTTDPQLLSLRIEQASTVREAVTGLAEPYRETVALRFFADLSLDEIARQTGRPLGTVKTHLHRGLQRLRGALGEAEAER